MAGPFGFLGEPLFNLISNVAIAATRLGQAQRNLPKAPEPFTREQEANQQPIALSGARAAALGRDTLPGPGNTTIRDITQAQFETEADRVMAQRAWNERMMGAIGDVRKGIQTSTGTIGSALAEIPGLQERGRAGFEAGRSALADSVESVSRTAAGNLRAIAASVRGFFGETKSMYSQLVHGGAALLGSIRDQTAARMVEAGDAIPRQTQAAISDYEGQARAMGLPEQNIMHTAAAIAADGSRKLGDMLTTIGISENERYTSASLQVYGQMAGFQTARVAATASVLSGAAGQAATVGANLNASRVELAKSSAALEASSAEWEAGVVGMKGNLGALYGQLAIDGYMGVANLLALVEDPVVQLGPIMEAGWSAYHGLEDLEYAYKMGNYQQIMASLDAFWGQVTSSLNRQAEINEARHAEGVQRNAASQDRAAGIGGSVINAAGQIGAGFAAAS